MATTKFEVGDIVENKKSGLEFMIFQIDRNCGVKRAFYHCKNKEGCMIHYYSHDLNLIKKWNELY